MYPCPSKKHSLRKRLLPSPSKAILPPNQVSYTFSSIIILEMRSFGVSSIRSPKVKFLPKVIENSRTTLHMASAASLLHSVFRNVLLTFRDPEVSRSIIIQQTVLSTVVYKIHYESGYRSPEHHLLAD